MPIFYVYIHGFSLKQRVWVLTCSAISITVYRHSACDRIIASQTLCTLISICAMLSAMALASCIHQHVKTPVLLGKSIGILSDGLCSDVSI